MECLLGPTAAKIRARGAERAKMESGPSRSGEATPSVVAGGADGGAAAVQRQALVPAVVADSAGAAGVGSSALRRWAWPRSRD